LLIVVKGGFWGRLIAAIASISNQFPGHSFTLHVELTNRPTVFTKTSRPGFPTLTAMPMAGPVDLAFDPTTLD
jgi:hypothetical protein